MDGTEILVILLVLAIVGVVAYFVYVYIKDKEKTDKSINDTIGMVNSEQADRVSNIKYVVDEVNNVNSAIYTSWSTSNTAIKTSIAAQNSNMTLMNSNITNINNEWTGFGKILNVTNSCNAVMQLQNLPGVAPGGVNINLLGKVVANMGLTGSNLTIANSATFCGADPSLCLKFPDNSGNTYLTKLTAGGSIILDAPTYMQGATTTMNSQFIANCNVQFCNTSGCTIFNNGAGSQNLLRGDTSNVGTLVTDSLKIGDNEIKFNDDNSFKIGNKTYINSNIDGVEYLVVKSP